MKLRTTRFKSQINTDLYFPFLNDMFTCTRYLFRTYTGAHDCEKKSDVEYSLEESDISLQKG